VKSSPLVSAIIPTYNRADLVCAAVDSVLYQTYPNVEVIVVDDGSTDATLERLAPYNDRIRVITQDNAGPAAARNRGIAASYGDLVAFLDSDDLWLPTKLERQVKLLSKTGPSVPCCLCNITMRWRNKEFSSFDIAQLNAGAEEGIWLNADEVLATRFVLFNQGVVIYRSVLERIGGFDETFRFLEDYELALRISLEGPWAFIREPLVIWRETVESCYQIAVQRRDLHELLPRLQILEKHLANATAEGQRVSLQQHLNRELRRVRRQLRAARMSQTPALGVSLLGNSLDKLEQYRKAFFIRSPWFPKMQVARPIPADMEDSYSQIRPLSQ
jgi:glycosyltransferase involved in cell wall biosynthesis